ncbi:hypothetical protein [Photobacterium chitinilyticum]|uniref:Lipoprotein n=1 Tax=Photobacterium chitinilyticum TaxID=2485123 RepID=A0A3S3S000_9GAMM|nr:hypothetical protein [Photobacterium chitinilyticum]RWX54585.1 hypothetical protein EDI28_15945 [Photobacterium chitinilyticum]
MKRYLLLIISLLTMLAGCVAYPVTRTYYEPNPNDGDPAAISGCGYHTTKNDSLERVIDGATIHVMPEYVDGEDLKVTISIKNEFEYVDVYPGKIFVKDVASGNKLYPSDTSVTMQMPSKHMPFYRQWVTFSFPVSVNELDELYITIPTGSLVIPNLSTKNEASAVHFRFNKTKKADFYYNSINC